MLPLSYRSPKTEVRPSPIHGHGLFATTDIAKNEIVLVKGGHIVSGKTLHETIAPALGPVEIQIGDDLYIAPVTADEREASMLYSNHSCGANLGIRGEITFVAMRDIKAGEELTHDWCTTDDDTYSVECNCGAPNCRGTLTGKDWQKAELQQKYRGYFSAYLEKKIRNLNPIFGLSSMYIPPLNRVEDRDRILKFIEAYGFATVISGDGGNFVASHLPVLLDKTGSEWGVLRSHMARANPQWRHFESGKELLCIFHGPHAYISPSWYVMQHTVPTWNYGAVHVYGTPKLVDEAALRQIVLDTTQQYESGMAVPWKIPLTESEIDKMLKAIVGFSIAITRVEAKFKLGQNRSTEDQEKMLKSLEASARRGDNELAEFIIEQRRGNAVE